MNSAESADRSPTRVVILDGSRIDDREAKLAREVVQRELQSAGIGFSSHILRNARIASCVGCHRCWTTTPGECVIEDDQKKICTDMAKSDTLVLVTPVTFGGYGSELKKSIDRLLPILLPYFREFDGETHHPSRYGVEMNLFAVGTMPERNDGKERLFKDLVMRNSLNMHSRREASCVVLKGSNDGDIEQTVSGELRKVIM